MKKLFVISMLMCGMMSFATVQGQTKETIKKIRKERKEISKMTKDELTSKVSKAARDAAKDYEKDGWKAAPGALPIERQLDRIYNMEYEYDENLMPKYVMGQATSVGSAYDAAKMQAMTLAKEQLAGQIATEVSVLVESKVENNQLSDEEAQSLVSAVSTGKQQIAQKIGRVMTVLEIYREKGKNKEVSIRVAYRMDMIMKTAKELMLKELEKVTSDAKEKIDNLFEGE